jgi:hypothetical protein
VKIRLTLSGIGIGFRHRSNGNVPVPEVQDSVMPLRTSKRSGKKAPVQLQGKMDALAYTRYMGRMENPSSPKLPVQYPVWAFAAEILGV